MMRRVAMMLGAALVACACGEDPARSVKIPRASVGAAATQVTTATSAPAAPQPMLHWNAAMCQPAPQPSGPSSVVTAGACAFEQREGATCVLTDDDLLMKIMRPTANDGQLMIFVTVENYASVSGRARAEIVVGVENAQGLFRWATENIRVKGSDEKSVTLHDETHLTAVPPLKEQDVIVSGTLTCASTVTAPDAR